jgi:hypothetical protein
MFFKLNYKLSNIAEQEILENYKDVWIEHFPHRLEFLPNTWFLSQVGKEVIDFLKPLNLYPYYTGLNVFISNYEEDTITNPHVDVLHKYDKFLPIKSRLNILCLGDSGKMFWWNKIKWGDKELVVKEFTTYKNLVYKSFAIPGDSIFGRLEYLKSPTVEEDNILKPSSFVSTEYAHSLKLKKGPRLVLSVGFNIELDQILKRLSKNV